MKGIQKSRLFFLLIFIFSAKIMVPAFASLHFFEKTEVEQQEEKAAEEKAGEKSATYKIDFTDFINFHPIAPPETHSRSLFADDQHDFFPVQYFAIPTPPPWCKS